MSHTVIEKADFVKIGTKMLIVNAPLPFDVFVKDGGMMKHIFNKGYVFGEQDRVNIEKSALVDIFINDTENGVLQEYLDNASRPAVTSPSQAVLDGYYGTKQNYFQIDPSLLMEGTEIDFSIFAISGVEFNVVVAASEAMPVKLEPASIPGTGDLIIKETDVPRYYDYIKALKSHIKNNNEAGRKVEARLLRENSKMVVKRLFDDPRSGQLIKETKNNVTNMVDFALKHDNALSNLASLRSYDYYSYTHSVNVTVLTIGLAMAANLKRDTIERLALGSLLHDLGKSQISKKILNKPSKLTPEEYEIMKTHVDRGVELISIHDDISTEAISAVHQHHERLGGDGYPRRLPASKIDLFGRITSIADCYDATTTNRPYSTAITPFYALAIMVQQAGSYDGELLSAFVKMLGTVSSFRQTEPAV